MSVNPALRCADGRRDHAPHFSREHYAAIGRRGGKRTLARYGRAHYAAAGELGGLMTFVRRGSGWYRRIGRRGARQRWKDVAPVTPTKGQAT